MVAFFTIVSVVLVALAIAQLLRVFEITSRLKGGVSVLPTDSENRYQGSMLFLFLFAYFGFFAWLVAKYGPMTLPVAASEHGELLDTILAVNFWIIILVFILTHIFLFYFAYKYVSKKGRKAYYYTHSNKLELLWTSVPAVFLAFIVIYGLSAWVDITDEAPEGSMVVELYPKQFDWTARYSGADTKLGASNYNMIATNNPLGVITKTTIKQMMQSLQEEIKDLEEDLKEVPKGGLKEEDITETIAKRNRQLDRVRSYQGLDIASLESGNDDILKKNEFYIPKGQSVNFVFRSRDVIHSAYMPHFRAQMNCVPGMTTQFHFVPTYTTEEMREITKDDEFEYYLLCNKICGAAHYNMKMVIKVVEPEEFNEWLSGQKTFAESVAPEDEEGMAVDEELTGQELSMIEQ